MDTNDDFLKAAIDAATIALADQRYAKIWDAPDDGPRLLKYRINDEVSYSGEIGQGEHRPTLRLESVPAVVIGYEDGETTPYFIHMTAADVHEADPDYDSVEPLEIVCTPEDLGDDAPSVAEIAVRAALAVTP